MCLVMTGMDRVVELQPEQLSAVNAGASGLGVYKPGLQYRKESLAFFKDRVGREAFERAMSSEAGRRHHYVAARALLDQADWEKFVWIEEYGSLDGFPRY